MTVEIESGLLTDGVLEARLADLPAQIESSEIAELTCAISVREAEEALRVREAELLTGGQINGANETARKAALLLETGRERRLVQLAEDDLAKARITKRLRENEFSALRAISRIRGARLRIV